MPDLPGFSSSETAAPPSREELDRRDREMRALAVWYETQDEKQVKERLGCKSLHEARVLVNRGVERWNDERGAMIERLKVRQQMDLDVIREGWMPTAGSDRSSAEINFKRLEVEGKLQGLNAVKEGEGVPQIIVVNTALPPEVLGDVIEGEMGMEALEPPSDHTDPSEETA